MGLCTCLSTEAPPFIDNIDIDVLQLIQSLFTQQLLIEASFVRMT